MVLFERDLWVSRAISFNTCAALTAMLWDWFLCLGDEYYFIWRKPHTSVIKWLYIFFRYGGLAAQIFDISFILKMESHEPISRSMCQLWITYQAIAVQVFLMCLDGLLILRVYAMWSRNRSVLCVLLVLAFLEASSMTLSAIVIVPDPTVNELCLFEKTPPASALFGAVALLTQSMILYFTLRKYLTSFARRLPRMNLSILVVRDGGIAFVGIFTMFFGTICYTILGSGYSDVMFFWIVCILPICGSRLIINMDAYAARTSLPYRSSDSVWLTSDIIMYSHESDDAS